MRAKQSVRMRELRAEGGQTSVLVIGLVVVCLLMATTMLAISSINLEARQLLSAADGASSSAAHEFTIPSDGGRKPHISQVGAARAVGEYIDTTGVGADFELLQVERVTVGGGEQTVQVQLSATARPPVISWFLPEGVTVYAESSARTSIER